MDPTTESFHDRQTTSRKKVINLAMKYTPGDLFCKNEYEKIIAKLNTS